MTFLVKIEFALLRSLQLNTHKAYSPDGDKMAPIRPISGSVNINEFSAQAVHNDSSNHKAIILYNQGHNRNVVLCNIVNTGNFRIIETKLKVSLWNPGFP